MGIKNEFYLHIRNNVRTSASLLDSDIAPLIRSDQGVGEPDGLGRGVEVFYIFFNVVHALINAVLNF